MKGTHLFFSPSGISSSSRSKSRCSSTDHAMLKVSDLGPRERFGLSFAICASFSAPLTFGEALRGGDRSGLGAFRDERLSPTTLTRGRHGVGVDETEISDVSGGFGRSTSTKIGLGNALSAWEVVLQANRSEGKRRQPDPTGQRCGPMTERVELTIGESWA